MHLDKLDEEYPLTLMDVDVEPMKSNEFELKVDISMNGLIEISFF